MKKFMTVLLVLAVAFTVFANGETEKAATKTADYRVAMISDYGDIVDQSFNQTTYEACKDYCEAKKIDFTYYKPVTDSVTDRNGAIEQAINDGYNLIVMPGYAFGASLFQIAEDYPTIKFVALDCGEGDFTLDYSTYHVPSNVYSMVYQEELAGYFAGYATVKLGYTKLGFLGGMAVPAVIRYGYGFVQGAAAAAQDLKKNVSINYVYGGQFFGDADITAFMDTWYKAGTEAVFACGGGIYTSAAEAAAKVGQKVVGVDVDQAPIIDGGYGKGMTVTSAMKGLYPSTQSALKAIIEEGKWDSLKGTIVTLGLVSATEVDKNYVGIPTGNGTQFKAGAFTLADYKALVADVFNGKVKVSADTTVAASYFGNSYCKVTDFGSIK